MQNFKTKLVSKESTKRMERTEKLYKFQPAVLGMSDYKSLPAGVIILGLWIGVARNQRMNRKQKSMAQS